MSLCQQRVKPYICLLRLSTTVSFFALTSLLSQTASHTRVEQKRISLQTPEQIDDFALHQRIAIVAGVGNYPEGSGFTQLRWAESDAVEVAQELRKDGYEIPKPFELIGARAMRGFILPALAKAKAEFAQRNRRADGSIAEDGTFIFYFSGHGRDPGNGENYLATFNATLDSLGTECACPLS